MKLTGTNRSIGLIAISHKPMRGENIPRTQDPAQQTLVFKASDLSTWWLCRGFPTRSHSELGR
jgi:hypothetical protein